jgi:hypothetical protein
MQNKKSAQEWVAPELVSYDTVVEATRATNNKCGTGTDLFSQQLAGEAPVECERV